jgi:hypothetical protein
MMFYLLQKKKRLINISSKRLLHNFICFNTLESIQRKPLQIFDKLLNYNFLGSNLSVIIFFEISGGPITQFRLDGPELKLNSKVSQSTRTHSTIFHPILSLS